MTMEGCPVRSEDNNVPIEDLPLPPGDLGKLLIGETIEFARDPVGFVHERRMKYGDIFCTNIILAKTVFLLDSDANHWIFTGEGKYLENKWNASTRQLLGPQCTAMLTGEEHTRRRSQLMPHFRHSALRRFAPTMQSIAARYYARWAMSDDVIVLLRDMQPLVFELIVRLLFGYDPQIDIAHLSRLFQRWTAGLAALPVNLPFTTFGRAVRANHALRAEIDTIVRRRQRLAEQPEDLLGSLLSIRDEAGEPLPHDAVVDEVHNQLFAGHDTTVTVMANLMLLLAQHPDVLARARAEVVAAQLSPQLDLDELKRLPYLNAVLNESMRCVTPVGGTFRVMLEDVAYKGYRIPKGWTVRLEIAGHHHHSEVWTAPEAFDPERWSPERAEHKTRPYTFLPFGGGPRICLGTNFAMAEMRVMLALLLRDYTWSLLPDQDLTYHTIPFPRPRSGIQVYFTALEVVQR